MLLTEQNYKRFYRTYYHGSPFEDIGKARAKFSCFFMTTSFEYALCYAYKGKSNYGTIFECHLKDNLDLFNTRCKSDMVRVEGYLRKKVDELKNDLDVHKYQHILLMLPNLVDNDFSDVLGMAAREFFSEVLKDCGYQGYFNYEITKKCRLFFSQKNMPAIGVFDIGSVIVKEHSSGKEILVLKEFDKIHQRELSELEDFVYEKSEQNFSKKQIRTMLDLSKISRYSGLEVVVKDTFMVLTKDEINKAVEDFDRDDYLEKNKEKLKLEEMSRILFSN